jgi:hypothetical protein
MRYLPSGKPESQELETRLQNWGNWSMDKALPKLGYPSQAAGFANIPNKGKLISENDADWFEIIISTMLMIGYREEYKLWPLYGFIMTMDYAERPIHEVSHVSHRAYRVRKAFNRRCAESTYYKHADRAKAIISQFSGPIR